MIALSATIKRSSLSESAVSLVFLHYSHGDLVTATVSTALFELLGQRSIFAVPFLLASRRENGGLGTAWDNRYRGYTKQTTGLRLKDPQRAATCLIFFLYIWAFHYIVSGHWDIRTWVFSYVSGHWDVKAIWAFRYAVSRPCDLQPTCIWAFLMRYQGIVIFGLHVSGLSLYSIKAL